jgi:hypothetical protein
MRSILSVLLALAPVAFTGIASASTMTVACSTLNGPTEINGNLVCPQFNGVGLQSIGITIDGTINGSITLVNNATITETGEGTTTSQFSVGSLAGFTIASPLFSAMFNTGIQSLAAGQTRTFSGLTGTGAGTITDSSVLAPYTGLGNFNIPVLTATMLMVTGGGGNFGGSQSTTANATATVTYTFGSSVPEIGTTTYLTTGLGAILLGLWRRRSR